MAFQILNNTNVVTVNAPNPALDGTGPISTLFTATGGFGSVLNIIRINTYTAVPVGMVRIFIKKPFAATWTLFKEVMIPESPLNNPPYPVFNTTIEMNLSLAQNSQIGVSTQTANFFNISAFGYDITGFI